MTAEVAWNVLLVIPSTPRNRPPKTCVTGPQQSMLCDCSCAEVVSLLFMALMRPSCAGGTVRQCHISTSYVMYFKCTCLHVKAESKTILAEMPDSPPLNWLNRPPLSHPDVHCVCLTSSAEQHTVSQRPRVTHSQMPWTRLMPAPVCRGVVKGERVGAAVVRGVSDGWVQWPGNKQIASRSLRPLTYQQRFTSRST